MAGKPKPDKRRDERIAVRVTTALSDRIAAVVEGSQRLLALEVLPLPERGGRARDPQTNPGSVHPGSP
jgi:hypothetical protein